MTTERKPKKILIYPNPTLRKVSNEWVCFDDEDVAKHGNPSSTLKEILLDMEEALATSGDGVALAAPQIGYLHRIVVLSRKTLDEQKLDLPTALINPKILELSDDQETQEEGCLSFPGIRVRVKRSTSVTVEYGDIEGNVRTCEMKGLWARAMLHEIEHCDGKLLVDHMSKAQALAVARQLTRR